MTVLAVSAVCCVIAGIMESLRLAPGGRSRTTICGFCASSREEGSYVVDEAQLLRLQLLEVKNCTIDGSLKILSLI